MEVVLGVGIGVEKHALNGAQEVRHWPLIALVMAAHIKGSFDGSIMYKPLGLLGGYKPFP